MSALCSVRGLAGTGLFVAAPGFAGTFEAADDWAFGLGGDKATGPPNFMLRESHNSGSRDAKLYLSVSLLETAEW